jgi:hypothetical protein
LEKASVLGSFPVGLSDSRLDCAYLVSWLSLILTIFMWGQWQKKLSGDPLSSESPYLAKILKTHWIRTSLISAYAIIVLVWVIQILA